VRIDHSVGRIASSQVYEFVQQHETSALGAPSTSHGRHENDTMQKAAGHGGADLGTRAQVHGFTHPEQCPGVAQIDAPADIQELSGLRHQTRGTCEGN